MNNKRKSYHQLRRFSWSNNQVKNEGEMFLESSVLEWYEAKHAKPSINEIRFVNKHCLRSCPYCNSNSTSKNGYTKIGIQRFICCDCGKRFNALTGTIFDSKKIPISERIEFLLHLFEFHSISSSSFDNRNSGTTGRFWLKQIFVVLKNIQDNVVLDGDIQIDEKALPVVKREIVKKANGKMPKGFSKNQLIVFCGISNKASFMLYAGRGKTTEEQAINIYGKHIKENSNLIHDGEKSHNVVIEKLHLKSFSYSAKELIKLDDKDNPLDMVNKLCLAIENFISAHGGYEREEIQDWLNLLWFILNGPKDRYDKVLLFIQMALKTRKRLKYREAIRKKDDTIE